MAGLLERGTSMQKILQALRGESGNHILPFLWIHGESEDVLREEIGKIQDAGIGALCVEARPHKDFNGSGWFHDLGVILDECERRDMKVWLLDDSHFPTGFANGEVKKNHPALRKKYLRLKTFDLMGPVPDSGVILKYVLAHPDDKILGVFLQKRFAFEHVDPIPTLDLTNQVEYFDDYNTGNPNADIMGRPLPGTQGACPVVRFDLPEGAWCLNVLTVSFQGGEKETEGYLNPIDPAATQILLDTVYQPVYDHFAPYFGKTFQGFFSDEPRFGNIHGAENSSIGRNPDMVLPWRDGLEDLLAQECTGTLVEEQAHLNIRGLLPLLFIGDSLPSHIMRYAYMNLVSRLYSEHFDGVLARWCHEHGCMRIGHVIEDNNAVARLGYGPGHYFRSMAHADMAGIDVVIHQLLPGFDKDWFKGFHKPGWDGMFFHYVLGKLGGSLAHLDPQKQGRCMCELFGAYGWAEGNRLGKWLVDYMLVRGVNELVPHAFDPGAFPDGDCPPHFYAHGYNPQYPEFKHLMAYANRLADLLSDGTPRIPVALLFHAEGEWSGNYMPTQYPAAALGRGFIDYAIIPADSLLQDGVVTGHTLRIHALAFKALVIPRSEALPRALLKKLGTFAEAGVPVYFIDVRPARSCEGCGPEDLEMLAQLDTLCQTVSLEGLATTLVANGIPELTAEQPHPYLRSYHYSHPDGELYFFVNEHPSQRIQTAVTGGAEGYAYVYDAFSNTLTACPDAFTLDLPPYGSRMVVVSATLLAADTAVSFIPGERLNLTACTVELAPMETRCAVYGSPIVLDAPRYVTTLPGHELFAGRIRYQFTISLTAEQSARPARIWLEGVREGAVLRVNGTDCGVRICPDYIFPITDTLRAGENTIEVELNTTLGRALNDFMSQYLPMEPAGLTGAVLEWAMDE